MADVFSGALIYFAILAILKEEALRELLRFRQR